MKRLEILIDEPLTSEAIKEIDVLLRVLSGINGLEDNDLPEKVYTKYKSCE